MEVALLSQQTIRIKSKLATIVVDAENPSKTSSDCLLFLSESYTGEKEGEHRLSIYASGEYEIGGIKITVTGQREKLVYKLVVDGATVIVTLGSTLEKPIDGMGDCDIVIVNADATFNTEAITALSPHVVVLYGKETKDGLKALGKEGVVGVSKYSTSKELPEEMEVVLLASS
jgi:hypothetical protein